MARPKKEQHKKGKDGFYTKKICVGTKITGEKLYKKFRSAKSWEEANKKAQEYLINQEVGRRIGFEDESKIRFKDVAAIVLELKKPKIKETTYLLKWQNVFENHLLPYFGNAFIREIRKNDIEMYFLRNANLSRETLRSHKVCIDAVFQNAVDNGYILQNPCARIRVTEGAKAPEKRSYTADQAELILAYCKEHKYGLGIDLMLRYGVSRSELCGITRDNIDLVNKTIDIKKGLVVSSKKETGKALIVGETKNAYRNRTIAICDDTIELIRKHDQGDLYLIHTKNGSCIRPDSWSKRHYNIFMRDMRLHYLEEGIIIPIYTPHELRHSRASIWVSEGKNLYAIAQQMGWADLDMLRKRYAHTKIEEIRKQLDL